jgi:hypothetical protein
METAMKQVILSLVLVAGLLMAGQAQAQPVLGPGISTRTVNGFTNVSYYERLYGGTVTLIDLVGDGYSNLDLFVYDEAGNLVASSIRNNDIESIRFVPPATGRYRIEVRNQGVNWSLFALTVK